MKVLKYYTTSLISILLVTIFLLINVYYQIIKAKYDYYEDKNSFVIKNCNFRQSVLINRETKKFLYHLFQLKGAIYKKGGNKPEEGLDCSGLIIYLFNELGYKWFRNDSMLVRDISADIIYRYNVKKIFNIKQLKRGDFIFFDQDDDNIMEHVSVFDFIDKYNNVWVWDASDYPDGKEVNMVSYRKINNFNEKHPYFGKPLKTCKVKTMYSYLVFP